MPKTSTSTISAPEHGQNGHGGPLSRFSNHETQLPVTKIEIPGAHGPVPSTVIDVGPRTPGAPIFVFLHGLVGLNEHWENVVRQFSASARCVMLQVPLLQLSGDDCSIHGVEKLTSRFLQDYFGQANDLPVVLVGNSFGGHVALRLAIDRPDLVRALVLAGSSGLIEKSMVSDVQIRPNRDWLRRKIGELFFDKKHLRESEIERAYADLANRSGARAMVRLSRSARRDHLGEKLGHIRMPTLLVWGREDIVTPPEAAEGFRSSIPGSRIVWFEQCGHAPMIECPLEFAAVLVDFAAELSAKPTGR